MFQQCHIGSLHVELFPLLRIRAGVHVFHIHILGFFFFHTNYWIQREVSTNGECQAHCMSLAILYRLIVTTVTALDSSRQRRGRVARHVLSFLERIMM